MIRANPTAISLRTSDLKLLQAEIEKRKGSDAPTQTATEMQTGQMTSTSKQNGGVNNTDRAGYNAVEEERRERQGRSVAERIGL
ncbi:hypothetical protein BD324DRAFT_619606 [Kockovaella imperatae]|uniref:Uncharacterized protein n=1 Tax=Kockovaella imperatae TaxID=4999 RepID=A0A1Y1UN21_9TREE|nr:hypothetical protein BD324DRAFT_619606 [Kockovaella imperatae]ORX39409.1 hypothetical protein BD324DRAFT_619606 [Kockovaella imperatae]